MVLLEIDHFDARASGAQVRKPIFSNPLDEVVHMLVGVAHEHQRAIARDQLGQLVLFVARVLVLVDDHQRVSALVRRAKSGASTQNLDRKRHHPREVDQAVAALQAAGFRVAGYARRKTGFLRHGEGSHDSGHPYEATMRAKDVERESMEGGHAQALKGKPLTKRLELSR